ncbi:MAG: hypothetical protein ACD_16C00217G0006 [uncultured bacterium]|nr:MAG: hypothetical protein ACD_16C00217G0006 [uncultured bacterium]OFW69533.1 MAG: hypothetical protein A2X70_03245 [Alphaproteobacteria bacterium GWC2_42_16]OFW74284.1 MAG: hypothetical protein A2Z80_00515 [Alphaproteobacteria bacterium GWA2_41_27]OFW84369.1 MAG: hypothetical protein A3E50_07500 [Alphaproteobacteria bacterium RIFCSPHIGHO2_12_FULL_42_100]OFW86060.1 MAG: hypothetical protein A2W06_04155 [Alphaproteobacteria bacterium RBG_16_42_14]OFW92100.1 MAG: hypothetical protein A3C41_000
MKTNLTIAAVSLCLSTPCLAADYTLQVQIQDNSRQLIVNTGSQNKPTPLVTQGDYHQFSINFDKASVEKNNLTFSLNKDGNMIYCSSSDHGPYIPFEDESKKTLSSLSLVITTSTPAAYACNVEKTVYK